MGEILGEDRFTYDEHRGDGSNGPEGEVVEFPLTTDPMRRKRLIFQQAALHALKGDKDSGRRGITGTIKDKLIKGKE